jgi:hypothetical protein
MASPVAIVMEQLRSTFRMDHKGRILYLFLYFILMLVFFIDMLKGGTKNIIFINVII